MIRSMFLVDQSTYEMFSIIFFSIQSKEKFTMEVQQITVKSTLGNLVAVQCTAEYQICIENWDSVKSCIFGRGNICSVKLHFYEPKSF